jgi:hypothetical protein
VVSEHAPAIMSFAEFARHAGFKASYVTQLKREGRLVLSDDGKAVKAAESLARILETRDPSKAAVAARHAAARASATAGNAPPAPPADSTDDDEPDAGLLVRHDYQTARAKREHISAEIAELEFRKLAGELIEVSALRPVLAGAVATLCAALDRIEHDVVPVLIGLDEEAMRVQIRDYVDTVRADLSENFAKMGRGEF